MNANPPIDLTDIALNMLVSPDNKCVEEYHKKWLEYLKSLGKSANMSEGLPFEITLDVLPTKNKSSKGYYIGDYRIKYNKKSIPYDYADSVNYFLSNLVESAKNENFKVPHKEIKHTFFVPYGYPNKFDDGTEIQYNVGKLVKDGKEDKEDTWLDGKTLNYDDASGKYRVLDASGNIHVLETKKIRLPKKEKKRNNLQQTSNKTDNASNQSTTSSTSDGGKKRSRKTRKIRRRRS